MTAKDHLKQYLHSHNISFDSLTTDQIETVMISFAEMHSKKALEVASVKARSTLVNDTDGFDTWSYLSVDKNSILTAYPNSNIK